MAMPPANAPQDNAQEDAKDGGADDAQEQGGGPQSPDDAKKLIIDVNTGLAQIANMLEKAGAPKQIVAEVEGCVQHFRSAMQALMSGGQGGGPQQQGAGSASPEQGGNPNAQPMG